MSNLATDIKVFLCATIALICSAIGAVYNHYEGVLLSNKAFIIVLFGVWLTDVILGARKHWKKRDFNFRLLFTRAMVKVGLSFAAMVLSNAFVSLPQIKDTPPANWFVFTMQMLNLVWIAGSAWTSCYYLSNETFPPKAFMQRLEKFNKSLDVKDIINKNEETN